MVVNLQELSFEELFNMLWDELCEFRSGIGINWRYAEMLVNVIIQKDIKQAQIEKAEALLAKQIIARLKELSWIQEKPINEQYKRIKSDIEKIQRAVSKKIERSSRDFRSEIEIPMTNIKKEVGNIKQILPSIAEREKIIKELVSRLGEGLKQE